MRTIRLLEAETQTVSSWKARWADPEEDKMQVVRDAFSEVKADINPKVTEQIISFGDSFVTNFINSMKWDEIGYDGNEFMHFLEVYGSDPSRNRFLKNSTDFTKAYNTYVDGNLDTDLFVDGSADSEVIKVYDNLLTNDRTFSYNLQEFRDIFENFIKLYDEKASAEDLKNIFTDENGDIRQPANIEALKNAWENKTGVAQPQERRISNNEVKNNIDNYAKTPEYVEYMKEVINNIENN